jgi:DNA-binding transcriptional ArsR family regulator
VNRRVTLVEKVNLYAIILADTNLPATSKVAAGWLLFYHHNSVTGVCNPSNRTIGKALGLRPENVSRHIRVLVNAGYVIARRRFGSSNSYDFNWARGSKVKVSALRQQLGMNRDRKDMTETAIPVDEIIKTPCSNLQDGHDENVNLIHEDKTVIEDGNLILSGEVYGPLSILDGEVSNCHHPEAQIDRVLSSFSSIYPLKIPDNELPRVRAALSRALKIATANTILDGAMSYANECTGREAQFIASPVNWLNGRRWHSSEKTKSEVAILGADGNAIVPTNQSRPVSRRQQIAQWTPSRKSPFSLQ